MSKTIIAAALIAAIAAPVAAQTVQDKRGIEVVARNELFAVSQPQGVKPAANAGVDAPSLFAVRPPAGVTPENGGGNNGNNGGGNNGGTAQIVAPPSGVNPGNNGGGNNGGGNNGGRNNGGATAQVVVPPSGINNGRNNAGRNNQNAGGGQLAQQIVIPPQAPRANPIRNQIATLEIPRNKPAVAIPAAAANLNGLAVNGVDSASDLYAMLLGHGYRVVVRATDHGGEAVFLAQGPGQRIAHYMVVDAHGTVLSHKTIDPAAYASGHASQQVHTYKPAHVATYNGGYGHIDNCAKPGRTNVVAYGYGRY